MHATRPSLVLRAEGLARRCTWHAWATVMIDRGWSTTRRVVRAGAIAAMGVGSAACSGESGVPLATSTQHVLRVQGDGAGSGTVTAPDAFPQISCSITRGAVGGVCGMAYPINSTVGLIATPNVGSTFAGWSGACAGTSQCVVEMSNERTVTAAFTPKSP